MTPNKEDYLKCIYEIGSRHKKITNKEIAQLMQVSPPAVTEMMKKMLAEELLVKDKKAGYLLTDLGLRLVSDLYRKHRLIEVFLVKTDEIHEEAEVLEHTVSERFVERLDAMLQYPKTCPHGGTIPAMGELLDEENQLTLEEASAPGDYIIKRLLKYLEKYNLQIGQTITFIQYDSFAQVYLLKTETQEIQINPMIAQQIYVEKL